MLAGAYAAAATPLTHGGSVVDESGFGPLTEFFAAAGLDGILALGTTGEGIALEHAERQRVAELFVALAPEQLQVVVHCGAQTTAGTVSLAAHAAEIGAAGVAVIAPPYFRLDDAAMLAHFAAAAAACAPLPFFVYEFERASGYAVPPALIRELQQKLPNLAGLKVSDAPWERFAPYLIDGLDVFVGPESLIDKGMEAGAVGAVSALATAFPEAVAAAVRTRDPGRTERLAELREAVERFPRHAALKHVLRHRGVAISTDVRAPLRGLSEEERLELERQLPRWFELAGVSG